MAVKPFGAGAGGAAGSTMPGTYEYKIKPTTGELQLWQKATDSTPARLVSEQSPDGTWLATSMSTGVGSVHLGGGASAPVHSMSSIGQNVGFKNEAFNSTPGDAIIWFPTWQGMSADLTVDHPPTFLSFGALQPALSMNGAVQVAVVPFDFVTTVASNLCVQSMTAQTSETYQGELKTIIRSSPKGVDLHASVQTVNINAGNQFTIEVPSLYFARAGDSLQFIMQKEDGTPLQVRGGTTSTAQPWRTYRCRGFGDVAVAPETAIKTASFLAKDGGTYIIEQPIKDETSGAGGVNIVVTIDDTVNTFTLMEGTTNVAAYSAVHVILGTDTIKFSKTFLGRRYEFFRSGATFIVIGSDGSRTKGDV